MKINYYKEKFEIFKNNPKKFWKILNEATDDIKQKNQSITEIKLNNGNILHDKINIANEFNIHFSTIGNKIIDNLKKQSLNLDKSNKKINNSMFLDPITENEISSIVKNLKNDVAPGIDGIQNYTLKTIIKFIAKPMTYIFNLCFTQGIFPSDLKNGIIVPIHKSDKKNDLNNYRPITLLPAFSKIFEKCINHRLLKHLRINNIISKNQFGFQKNVSTDDALFSVTGKIIKELDVGNKVLGIFLDLQKAFDTVSHKLLLEKLYDIRIGGIVFYLFESF